MILTVKCLKSCQYVMKLRRTKKMCQVLSHPICICLQCSDLRSLTICGDEVIYADVCILYPRWIFSLAFMPRASITPAAITSAEFVSGTSSPMQFAVGRQGCKTALMWALWCNKHFHGPIDTLRACHAGVIENGWPNDATAGRGCPIALLCSQQNAYDATVFLGAQVLGNHFSTGVRVKNQVLSCRI